MPTNCLWTQSYAAPSPRAAASPSSVGSPPPVPAEVDVAIVGGGFTGLWTAYYLLRSNPGLGVVVVEAEQVGFGASGRNGGWVSALFPVGASRLAGLHGVDATRDLLAEAIAKLEGGAGAVITASGMAAVDLLVSRLPAGAQVVAPHDCYGGTIRLLKARAEVILWRLDSRLSCPERSSSNAQIGSDWRLAYSRMYERSSAT